MLRPKTAPKNYVVDTQTVPTTHFYTNLEFLNNFSTTSQLYHNINNTEQRNQAAPIWGTRIASAGSNATTSVRVVVLQNEPWAQSGAAYRLQSRGGK